MSDDTEARELLKAEYADMPYVAEGIDSGEIGTREIRAINNTLRQRDEAHAQALEECAKIADEQRLKADSYVAAELGGPEGIERNRARYQVARDIAASIRALANDKGDGR